MAHGSGLRTFADTDAELVAALIHGYAETQDAVAAARARIQYAVWVQVTTQAAINVGHGHEGCTPEQLDVLYADRSVQPAVREWSAPVPLILIDCFYAPITEVPAPTEPAPGRILWLRPRTDADLVRSLAGIGVIRLTELTELTGTDGGRARPD
jgi:hypothetical protein